MMLGGAVSVGTAGLAAGSDPSTLAGRLAGAQEREGELHAGIGADRRQIAGFQGRIEDLRARLNALQTTLAIERRLLASLKGQLHSARIRLVALRAQLARYRQVLVAQVVAAYAQPPPDIATVILEANGFADLLERLDSLHAISHANALATKGVADAKQAVAGQEAKLAALEASRARETRAVLVQRNEVAQLHLALVDRQLQFIRARDRKSAELASLGSHKRSLEHQLSVLQARELATAGGPAEYGSTGSSPAPEGSFGFFPAAGTNYSVGEEPALAARLNTLGKALHLHLIGISGYRSPQHSVEVGGFANDPHTRGEASDTPGVEGVSEATLNRFGLTRPFPGAAEADHIQLAGSA
jgi:peptidoglycan hydrolase CwlO-like protein